MHPSNGSIVPELMDMELSASGTAQTIFDEVDSLQEHDIPWKNGFALSVDNAGVNVETHNSLKCQNEKQKSRLDVLGWQYQMSHNTATAACKAFSSLSSFDVEHFCLPILGWKCILSTLIFVGGAADAESWYDEFTLYQFMQDLDEDLKQQMVTVDELSTNEAVFGLEFNPADSGNIITCGKSHVFFWTWSGGALTKKQGIFGIPEQFGAVRTIAEVKGEELLIGTTRNAILKGSFSDGFVPIVQYPEWQSQFPCVSCYRWVVLDIETKDIVSDYTDGNEQLSVVRYSPDGSYLAVGSHDNFIYIYTVAENGRRYTRFGRCTGHSSFITHLDWSKESKFIMSNSGDYEILYWDVAGGCKLLRNRFDSKDREWASYTCVLGFHVIGVWLEGSDGTDINALCRSHNERVVAVADDFCKVHLFQYPCPKPKAPSHRYDGHGSHVTNVRFTHNDSHLISMGGKDTSILQWRVMRVGLDRSRSVSSTSNSSVETGSCG
ncbi:UNVERIFIED_CONTAM: hypothetical protein FKN15_045684 [Acipenser sinensis]